MFLQRPDRTVFGLAGGLAGLAAGLAAGLTIAGMSVMVWRIDPRSDRVSPGAEPRVIV